MKKIIIALGAVILIALFLSTFIEHNDKNENVNSDNILISVTNSNFGKDDENIICATSRGLVKSNNSNEVIPDLAEDIQVSKDGIEYNFILKDDICWSDGEKIKPQDILTYFKWLIRNNEDNYISALLNVYGVKNFKEGKGSFEKDVALTTEGNNIKVRLNKKDDDFLLELSKPQYRIRRDLSLWSDIESNYKNISYSGMYYIKSMSEDEIELKKNDDDKEIVLLKDDNEEDAMASYEVGERDVVVDPPVSQTARLDKNKRVLSSPKGEGIYMAINPEKIEKSSRKEIVRELYKVSENYYENNKKSVKFSEGSYFEKDMDELDKLQSRKVSISNGEEGIIPGRLKIMLWDDDTVEDFSKWLAEYLNKNDEVNVEYKKISDEEVEDYSDFDIVLFKCRDDVNNKTELYSCMEKIFPQENKKCFSDISKVEENLFNSYTIVPVMFINRNIAVSDKVSNIKLDGNGNIDFSAIN